MSTDVLTGKNENVFKKRWKKKHKYNKIIILIINM